MSAKDLESEFKNLKIEFEHVKVIIDNLVKKYGSLEKKYAKSLSKKKMFKCNQCDEELENVEELKKHKEEHSANQDKFQCEECLKSFEGESQLESHVKRVHKKYECDECDKVFNFEIVLERHKETVHEDIELFCHFFNNKKECPHDEQCIFLHEESAMCKYGSGWERKLCMFRHEEKDDDESETEDDSSSDDEETVKSLQPTLDKVKNSIEKVNALLRQVCPTYKCDHCDFEAKNQNGLNMHAKAKHTNNKS